MSTPITPQTNAHAVSTPAGATPRAVEVKCQSFTKHIGAVFHNSLLVPINLGANTLKLMGKNLPVFQWIKSLFSSPKSGPVRHSEKFQECLNELHKTTLSIAWDRANKEKTEARENWTNIRAKIIEALPISSTRPAHTNVKTGATVTLEELLKATNDEAPEQAGASNPEAQTSTPSGDKTKSLPDANHLLELNQGWENLATLIAKNLATLKRSARADRPFADRLFQKLQNSVKPSSIEAELLNGFKTDVLATIQTIIEQAPQPSTPSAKPTHAPTTGRNVKFVPRENTPVKQAIQEITTEEIKQAMQATVDPTKTAFLTRLETSIKGSHSLPKEQITQIIEPLIEALDNPANDSIVIDVLGKPQTLTGEHIKQLNDIGHPKKLNQGWKSLETLIGASLKRLQRSARAYTKPLNERIFLELQRSLKPESIEALLTKNCESLVKETIKTMIEQAPKTSTPTAKAVAGRPPRHPNPNQPKPRTEKAYKQIATPTPEERARAQKEKNALRVMIEKATHQKIRARFAIGLPLDDVTPEELILKEVTNKLKNEGKEPPTALITQLINEALDGVELRDKLNLLAGKHEFTGSYFKKTITTLGKEKRLLSNTLVMGAGGNTYELLNTLTKQDVADIEKHGVARKIGKTVLGQGGFGTVRLARNINDGTIVAVKKISSQYEGHRDPKGKPIITSPEADQDLNIPLDIQERIALKQRGGENVDGFENSFALFEDHAIIGERPVWDKTKEGRVHLHRERNDKVYIFSELANMGDGEALITHLNELKKTNPAEAETLFLKTAVDYTLAVKRLHSLGFHHRDIKPENFLHSQVDGIEQKKLADFGLTKDSNDKNKWAGGTDDFAPPEGIDNKNPTYRADKHDAFSLGVTLQRIRKNLTLDKFYTELRPVYSNNTEAQKVVDKQNLIFNLSDQHGQTKEVTVELFSKEQRSYQGIDTNNLQGIDINNLDMTHLDNIIAKLLISAPEKRMSVGEAYEHLARLANPQENSSTSQQ